MIAYTSEFIPRMVYKYKYSRTENLVGYIDASLSGRQIWRKSLGVILAENFSLVFNTSDYNEEMSADLEEMGSPPDLCQYRGMSVLKVKKEE